MKRCIRCNVEKPLKHFYKCSKNKDNKLNYCISCRKEQSWLQQHKRTGYEILIEWINERRVD